jgi:hypothetical protein
VNHDTISLIGKKNICKKHKRNKKMSIILKMTNDKEKIASLKCNTITPKKLSVKNIIFNRHPSIITDPIEPKHISKDVPTNGLSVCSVVKAGLVFFATVGVYYLVKTTCISSYFGWREKILNSKDADSRKLMKVKNEKKSLSMRRNLKTTEQVNNSFVNQIVQTHKDEDGVLNFEEIKVEEFKNLRKMEEKNVMMRRFFDRRSISVKNPIPNQNIAVKKLFNLTIDGTNVFNSNSSLFLEAKNPTWLTSQHRNPKLIGSYNVSNQAFTLALSENYAYLASRGKECASLQIIDITDPTNPKFKGSYYNISAQVPGITLLGNYAFIMEVHSLKILNITNPANPIFKGAYNDKLRNPCEVAVSENYAYVADFDLGLQIIDISDPANPTFKGSYYTDNFFASRIALSENYAYVTTELGNLEIIDISNPANPTFKGSYNTHSDAYSIAVFGNYAYVGCLSNLQIIDISNPANPTFKGWCIMPEVSFGGTVSGNYAYVGGLSSLQIIDISNPANPTFKSSYDMLDKALEVVVSGNYVYLATGKSGLQIIAPDLDKLILSGKSNSLGTYRVNIKACNEEKECAIDNFNVIVSMDLTTILIIIGSIVSETICAASFCCSLIGGGGIMILKRYRNRNKILKSAMLINESQIVENNYFTMSNEKNPKFLPII